jgi:hypothetical protein
MAAMDARHPALIDDLDRSLESLNKRIEQFETALMSHMDARFARFEATMTWRMVVIFGVSNILIGSALAWALVLLR